jgi:Phospholipase_D-nuclease N-terminal
MIEHIEVHEKHKAARQDVLRAAPAIAPGGGYTVASRDEGTNISGQRDIPRRPSCSVIRRFTLVPLLIPLPESTMTHNALCVQLIFPAAYSSAPGHAITVDGMIAALVLIAATLLVAAWEFFCLADLVRADRVRFLPRWAWAMACLLLIPVGGILYLLAGRAWGRGLRGPGSRAPHCGEHGSALG